MALTTQAMAEGAVAQQRGQQHKLEDLDSDLSTDFGSDCDGAASEDDPVSGACPHFTADETLLILDWDDTLLPTSWIEAQGLRLSNDCISTETQRQQLHLMAERAALTLHVAKSYGTVVIVTNAEHGWIELSCEKFMPTLLHALKDVKILSARSRYESQGVAQPCIWKLLAFDGEIGLFFGGGIEHDSPGCVRRNVISVGDSPYEREALIRVTDRLSNSWAKSFKLTEKPTAEEFLSEHEILCSCLGDIVDYEGNLDLSISSP